MNAPRKLARYLHNLVVAQREMAPCPTKMVSAQTEMVNAQRFG